MITQLQTQQYLLVGANYLSFLKIKNKYDETSMIR